MEKYTALYPRVSTDKQAMFGTSLQYQEESCMTKAKELGVPDNLIKIYREEGASGEDIDRPQMNKLREDVAKGIINRIIILHPDRLSRNMVDRLIVCAEFEKYEAELIFVDAEYKNTEEGKLFFNIQSSIAQYELALIKKRTRRGSIKAVQNGEVMPMRSTPYGYDYVDKKLVVNKTEAEFVKKIYQWYVFDKLTMRQIGEKLCSLGAIPKRKKIPEWSASSIQNILKSETYIGKFYYNRRQVKKIKGEKTKSGKPKRTYKMRDKEEWIEISVPAVIDPATFLLAQEQREKNTKHSGNIKHEYLLRQKIRCGHCGNKFASYSTSSKTRSKKTGEITSEHSYRNYRCTNKTSRKFGEDVKKCESKVIRADHIEEYLWDNMIMKIINNTDEVIRSMQNKHEKPSQEIEETYNLLKFKIAKLEEEKKRTIQLFKKAYIDEEEMDRDMKQIDSGIKDLKKEIEKYENQMFNIGKNQLNIKILKERVEEVKKRLENEDILSFELKRQLIDYFIDEVILKWEGDDLTVTTIGVIDYFFNEEKLRELSTQQKTDMDTTNIVINILFEASFLIDNSSRSKSLKVKKQDLKIG
jgi:site-specific DNA recombinase